MKLLIKKVLAYLIDYVLVSCLMELYFFCANVFFLENTTKTQGYLMLVCALVTLLLLTSYLPTYLKGQTLGQKLMKIKVVNQNGQARTYVQSFIREGIVKITFAPLFVIFTTIYFIINLIVKRDFAIELPHDFILKTTMQKA